MFKNFLSALFKKNTGLKNGAGLTLVELMVVVAIMMIMTAVVFVNYQPGNQQLALNRSAHKLAQDIRRAQEMAMSSAEVGGVVPHGVGIVMAIRGGPAQSPVPRSTTKYYIYADMDGSGELEGANEIPQAPDIVISTVDFERGVRIAEIDINTVDSSALHRALVNFSPPDPEVNIIKKTGSDTYDDGTEMRIILELESDSSKTKTVVINNAGLIYVE